MLVSPLWADLNNLLRDYLRFMDDHFRESADLTFLAYRHRNYSKVIEFVQFKEWLQRSNQYLLAKVEAPILQLKQNADNLEEQEVVIFCLARSLFFCLVNNNWIYFLSGNRVLSSLYGFCLYDYEFIVGVLTSLVHLKELSYCPQEKLRKEREESVRRVVEKRSLLPRMIYLSIQSGSASLKENVEDNGSVSFPNISSELKFFLERYANVLGSSFSDAIEVVMGVYNGSKSSEIGRVEHENIESILFSIRKEGQDEGPGNVFQVIERVTSSIDEAEFGVRISQGLKSWNAVDVARKIVNGDSSALAEILHICELKLK
ncbi:hypothetical protein Tsubulata_038479 [Turnera subulata]|uniref:Uncharacterized protein n=1 Tax=Turnera subulata TaxID=218843 RepID=A0A9Q0GB97_9ROSI|nr:hypothetical protein Tsubulata_038479 [Turnera subulata]